MISKEEVNLFIYILDTFNQGSFPPNIQQYPNLYQNQPHTPPPGYNPQSNYRPPPRYSNQNNAGPNLFMKNNKFQ